MKPIVIRIAFYELVSLHRPSTARYVAVVRKLDIFQELEDLNSPEEIQVPIVEPLFDDNANMLEAPGVGAGAGDGRGIHSDHSHDSSGQGTSISSSETSSGLQSEVHL